MPSRSQLHPLSLRLRPPFWTAEPRPCAREGCPTPLNGYNPGPFCLIHTPHEAVSDAQRSLELDREAKRHERLTRSKAI